MPRHTVKNFCSLEIQPAGGLSETSSEVAMSAATSACGQDAASPGIETPNSASPRLATSTYVLCWSSVPTMCSVRMGETPRYDSGVCTWPRAEASSPAIGLSSPSLANWQYCFIASGSPRSHTFRSME